MFTWDKGKLVRFYDDIDPNSSSSSDDYRFTYDAYGRRLSKVYEYDPGPDYSGDFTTKIETNYYYDHNGRLVRETSVEYFTQSASLYRELIYLYDESGIIGVLYNFNNISTKAYYYHRNLQGDVISIFDQSGVRQAEYAYDAYGNCEIIYDASGTDIAEINPIRYRGYYYDRRTKLYYLNSRYYNPEWRRFISPDDTSYLDTESVNGLNLYCYCGNDPVNYADPSGHFMISTAVLIGTIIGAAVGIGGAFGIVAYNDYKDDGEAFNGSIKWYNYLGATILGGVIGAVIGGAIGYGVGYLAGGTYSNGLVAKAVKKGVKTFMSQTNKVNHVLGKTQHNLSGYTAKSMVKLMRKTLAKGTFEAYKTVNSMVLLSSNSQVTYVIINGAIMISDMWIKTGG